MTCILDFHVIPFKIATSTVDLSRSVNVLAWSLGIRGLPSQNGCGLFPEHQKLVDAAIQIKWNHCSSGAAGWVLFPHTFHSVHDVHDFDAQVTREKKFGLLLLESDFAKPLQTKNTLVLRNSAFRSKISDHEGILPAFCSDPLSEVEKNIDISGVLPSRGIGFIGYTGTPLSRVTYWLTGRREKAKGLQLRNEAISRLRQSGFHLDIVCRAEFRAGMQGDVTVIHKLQKRTEYLKNLYHNQFSLVVRGAGNFSYRFYEALALGRIPIVVETDDVLPLESSMDWSKHIVRVKMEELEGIGRNVDEFLGHHGGAGMGGIFASNRALWLNSLSITGFLANELPKILNIFSSKKTM